MFLTRRPSPRLIDAFLEESRDLPLSYEPIGLAVRDCAGFDVDQQTRIVGRGEHAFERARQLLEHWRHFDIGWVEVFPKDAALKEGSVVAVLARHLGVWSLSGCRVVYTIGTEDRREFGYAYGTLTNHAEIGEEIFKVRFHPETGHVSYTIHAVSRPGALLTRLGYPVARRLQARFRRDSARALARALAE